MSSPIADEHGSAPLCGGGGVHCAALAVFCAGAIGQKGRIGVHETRLNKKQGLISIPGLLLRGASNKNPRRSSEKL